VGVSVVAELVAGLNVQIECFSDTRASGVGVDQLASGTSSAASEMGGRSFSWAMRSKRALAGVRPATL